MSNKFKKHYTGFNRQILAEFMGESELARLDENYNGAKIARVKRKYLLTKTPKERKKQDIIDFFKLVCQGIRNEYEDGASHRNQNVDLNTLRTLLKDMIKKFANQELSPNAEYKKICHIISNLYKIKTINRRQIYKNEELKKLVLDTSIGKQVIQELKDMKVTQMLLDEYDLLFFNAVFKDEFPEL